MTLVLRTVLKDVKIAIQVLIQFADRGQVLEPVAIVGRGPYRSQLPIEKLLKALLADLVSPIDPDAAICVEEAFNDIGSEHVASAAVRELKPTCVTVGIRPHQVCEWALMWNLLYSFDLFDVIDVLEGRRQASMHAEDLAVDRGSQGQKVKNFCELLPDDQATILALTLDLEAVDLRDLA